MTRTEARALYSAAIRDGGFTYDVNSHTHPVRGYAFSETPEHERKLRILTPAALLRYARDYAEALRAPGAHFGAWKDGGFWYLDVSRVVEDRTLATCLARIAAQLAVYDLATRQSFGV